MCMENPLLWKICAPKEIVNNTSGFSADSNCFHITQASGPALISYFQYIKLCFALEFVCVGMLKGWIGHLSHSG